MTDSCLPSYRLILPECICGSELHLRVGKWSTEPKKIHTEQKIRAIMENLSHNHRHHNHHELFYHLFMVRNKENKDEEFLSFLCLSFGLFLSDVSVLTPKPWKTLKCFRFVGPNKDSASLNHFTLLPSISLFSLTLVIKKLLSQKNLCNSSCISGRHLARYTQTSKQKVIILLLLERDKRKIQSPLWLDLSVCEGAERGMSYRGERKRNRKREKPYRPREKWPSKVSPRIQ